MYANYFLYFSMICFYFKFNKWQVTKKKMWLRSFVLAVTYIGWRLALMVVPGFGWHKAFSERTILVAELLEQLLI